jgi:hypothetical protein
MTRRTRREAHTTPHHTTPRQAGPGRASAAQRAVKSKILDDDLDDLPF